MKKYLSYFLALVMLASCLLMFGAVTAETVHATSVGPVKYWLDMGVQQVWTKEGSWEGQIKPADEITVKSVIELPKPVEIVGYHTVESCNFNFEDKAGIYGYNKSHLIFDEASYQRSYGRYKAVQISPITATATENKVTINYKAKLGYDIGNGGKEFNLAEYLYLGELKTGKILWGLLGGADGKEGVKKHNPVIYEKWQTAYEKGLDESVQAYLYFTPTVIAYREILTCGICGQDKLTSGEQCNKDTCPSFGKPECGCYTEEVAQVTPPAGTTGGCTDVIKWSEQQSHKYKCSGCKTKTSSNGKKTKYCPEQHTCNHVYTYQSKLTASGTLASAKPNGNSTTMKSGYGFTVTVDNSIATSQTGNSGACGKSLNKANDKKSTPPTSAEVRNGWSVKIKGVKATQPKTVVLAKGATTGTTSKFVTAKNPLSQTKNAQIYTDVSIKGTKQKPVKHTVNVYSYGGGVNGVQFCKNLPLTFTINGNMYEDDWTVDGSPGGRN